MLRDALSELSHAGHVDVVKKASQRSICNRLSADCSGSSLVLST